MAVIKNTSPEGIARIPSAFKIEEITITNKIGEAVDIQTAVQAIEINESLYSPTLICKVTVLDESNILESLPLYGIETIFIKISRKQLIGPDQIIERLFYATEYPLFGRPKREHTQVWSISGVSYHSWKNALLKMSRYYNNLITDEIIKICKESFGLEVLVEGNSKTEGRGIINIQSPLQAVEWFRRRIHEKDGTPFYFYEINQNLPNQIFLKSHTVIANLPPYNRYYDARDFNKDQYTPEDYESKRQRMIEVSSQLKLSKLIQVPNGTFASENNYLDLATRTFYKKYYRYPADFPIDPSTINKTNILEPPPTWEVEQGIPTGKPKDNVNEEDVGEALFSYMDHLSLNTEAFIGQRQNYNVWAHEKIDIMNAFPGVFNTLMHDIKVFGDFELNPGKKVELFFPKAIDPEQSGIEEVWDKNLSGEYIVTSATHRFKDQEYYTEIRVKRDSFSKK